MPRHTQSTWRFAMHLWDQFIVVPIKDRAHALHDYKEEWFRSFFERTVIGWSINRYTTANQWSIMRFPLAAVLLACLLSRNMPAAFSVIVVIGCTDLIDGPLARQQGTANPQGTRLESLADSVCIWTMFIALYYLTTNMVLKLEFQLASALEIARLGAVAFYEQRVNLEALGPNQSGKYKFVFYVAGALAGCLTLIPMSPPEYADVARALAQSCLGLGVYLSLHSLVRHRIELESMLRPQSQRQA